MQIIHTLTNDDTAPLALTIGNFDGVHIGHQAILRNLVSTANHRDLVPAAMTFSPHAKVFFGNANDFLITSDSEKADCIATQGIKQLYQIPFDAEFSAISPRDFVDTLIHQLNVKHLLVGDDFRFGHRGQGDFALLAQMCNTHGVSLAHTPTITLDAERVSSSRVREAIKAGNFTLVAKLLGREMHYRGTVIAGKQLGRTIDFPTANIRLPMSHLLPDGVFAVKVELIPPPSGGRLGGGRNADTPISVSPQSVPALEEGANMMPENDRGNTEKNSYYGMCNIGTKPTVDDSNTRQIETHIFDFSGDLYGKEIAVTPIAKLRDEQKFDGVEALVAQLHRDKARALKKFSHNE